MDEHDLLAERFEEHRTAAARRGLPDARLAERGRRRRPGGVAAAQPHRRERRSTTSDAWLTTVVARVSLNMLRARRARREEPLGVHLPDPIVDRADGTDPEHEALLADAVGLALLVVLETLSPAERLAFVLHDMFAVPFDEIAPIVDRSPEAARQLASRARRRVRGEHAEPDADLDAQREVVDAFLAAARDGDFEALLAVLDPDVVLRADIGPARGLPREVRGAEEVAGQARPTPRARPRRRPALVNGAVGRRRDARRRAVLGRRPHDQRRPDRRDRHPRRPRAAAAARPDGRGRAGS